MSEREFAVVFVCTGNRFRSPLAAAFLRRAVAGDVSLSVTSLGTLELGPTTALPEAVELAADYGVDLSDHRARSLGGIDLTVADLVVGFERRHVAAAVVDAGAASERTFTLPELVGLLDQVSPPSEGDPVRRARAAIERAHAARPKGFRRSGVPGIPDPLGLPARAQRAIGAQLHELIGRLARELFGSERLRHEGATRGTGSRRGWSLGP